VRERDLRRRRQVIQRGRPAYFILPFSCCTLSFRDQDAARQENKKLSLPHTDLPHKAQQLKQTQLKKRREEREVKATEG
jgi:hypothetical protein